jgi:phospholipase/carboxylesterase
MPQTAADAPLEILPTRRAQASVIWLHGLGANAEDLAPAATALAERCAHPLHFVLPRAPRLPVTLYHRFRLRAWFDVVSEDFGQRGSPEGLDAAVEAVERLALRERERGVAPERLLLAGFSQGGAVALHAALRRPGPLLGVAALSTYLPHRDRIPPDPHARAVFLGHAPDDDVVPIAIAESARDWLREQGHALHWWTGGSGHRLGEDAVGALAQWLDARLDEAGG